MRRTEEHLRLVRREGARPFVVIAIFPYAAVFLFTDSSRNLGRSAGLSLESRFMDSDSTPGSMRTSIPTT